MLDNSGYEVFTDLCLADFIISKNFATSIRIYVKTIPWFISDVMKHDFDWMLHKMETSNNENLKTLATRWKSYLANDIWTIVESHYWTLPYDFPSMKKVDPALYAKLSEAKAIFFKGKQDSIPFSVVFNSLFELFIYLHTSSGLFYLRYRDDDVYPSYFCPFFFSASKIVLFHVVLGRRCFMFHPDVISHTTSAMGPSINLQTLLGGRGFIKMPRSVTWCTSFFSEKN